MTAPHVSGQGPVAPKPPEPICSPLECPQGDGRAPGFAAVLAQALGDVSQLQTETQDAIGRFLRGEGVPLHQVMAAAEEASIALELLVEIRNKLAEAYRTIMNIQV